MRPKNFLLIVAMILAGSQFAFCQGSDKQNSVQQKDSVYYTCSMHPEIHSPSSGSCPKCGMQLIKVDANHPKKKSKQMMMGCGMMGGMKPMSDTQKENLPQDSISINKLKYTCPMHPEAISDKPGSCPKCGMDLIEIKKH